MRDRIWTVEEANDALPRVTDIVERARAAIDELRAKADATKARSGSNGHSPKGTEREIFAAAVDELGAEGIVLRDVDRGLIDFPAVAPSGRPYWLCWLVGEAAVTWWHWPEDGFAGRTPLDRPPE